MSTARSTRASAAVDRLKVRSGNAGYSMARTGDGLFFSVARRRASRPCASRSNWTTLSPSSTSSDRRCARRVSKLDVAFEKQLVEKTRSRMS